MSKLAVEGLTKSFGRQVIWGDVTLTLPPGEISVMLGPGTGKSVFLKTLVGLLKPDRGSIFIRDVNLANAVSISSTKPASSSGCCFRTVPCSGR